MYTREHTDLFSTDVGALAGFQKGGFQQVTLPKRQLFPYNYRSLHLWIPMDRQGQIMAVDDLHVVTGSFGFSGKYITERLLAAGKRVRTLTGSPRRDNPFNSKVEISPYHFKDKEKMVQALHGASVLYNTYWVRFSERGSSQELAVENTMRLFDAARDAKVGRVVHVSITNPSLDSRLEYFRGKAMLEEALGRSGLSYSILRPAVLFGEEDILVNNIAWVLRRLPVFGVFGDGDYKLQPIYVGDFADLAVAEGGADGNRMIDVIGPDTFTYRGMVRELGEAIGCRRPIISVPPRFGYGIARVLGWLLGDVLLTWDEIQGLMAGLLSTESPPVGRTSLRAWAASHAEQLGKDYANELARRRDRRTAYKDL